MEKKTFYFLKKFSTEIKNVFHHFLYKIVNKNLPFFHFCHLEISTIFQREEFSFQKKILKIEKKREKF